MDPDTRRVCDFLRYGYCPSIEKAQRRFDELCAIAADDSIPVFRPQDPASAKKLLVEIVREKLDGAERVVIPISAGYDSRALLGATLEILPSTAITLFTIGHKGADDFERARSFTKGIVDNHALLDVTDGKDGAWNTDELIRNVAGRPAGEARTVGETGGGSRSAVIPAGLPRLYGFLGDTLSGKKLPIPISSTWRHAVQKFVSRNRAFEGAIDITPPDYRPEDSLPASPLYGTARITFDDQLDWCFRQEQRIRPSLKGQSGAPRKDLLHPYDDPRWWRS